MLLESAFALNPRPTRGLLRNVYLTPHSLALRCALLTLAALAIDYSVAPHLFTGSTLWAAVIWCVLIARHPQRTQPESGNHALLPPSANRIFLFACLHISLAAGAVIFFSLTAASPSPLFAVAKAASKVLVLAPTLLLLPFASWQLILRRYRNETIAAALALTTFFPWRIFEFEWNLQAQLHASAVYFFAKWFVPGLSLLSTADPVLVGPYLDVIITPLCTPMYGVHLFQNLFAVAVLLEWNHTSKARLAAAYAGGLLFMLGANVFRIFLMVVLGNLVSAQAVVLYHADAARIFSAIAFAAFFLLVQPWLRNSHSPRLEPAVASP